MINLVKFYFIATILIISFYNLGWSNKYEDLNYINYLIDVFFILLILPSFFMIKKQKFFYQEIKVNKQIILVCVLNMLEFLYTRKIPILEIVFKKNYFHGEYQGIPSLHVLIYQYSIYISMIVGYNMLISKDKKWIYKYLLSLSPMILIYSRFGIILSLFTTFNIFLYINRKKILKYIFQIICIVLILGYLFGISGNIRSGFKYNDNEMILSIGGATEEFKTNLVPNEYFWSYIYLTSSLANFQKTVIETSEKRSSKKEFVIQAILPSFISKRLTKDERKEFAQISTALNAAPDITFPYMYLKWEGVIIFLFLKAIFINIYVYIILTGRKQYRLINLNLLICFIFFNFINNFFIYGGFILLPLYGIVYSFKRIKLKIKYNKTV